MHYVAGHGVTTVHDMFDNVDDGWAGLETYRRAEARGDLITRIYAVAPL
jgi:predicted amidohydrolase YtcJ